MSEEIQSYMRLAEQRVGAAFVAEGLYVHHCGAWQGPHTLTFAARLYEPRTANINKALKLGGSLEAALGASPVRVYADQGVIFAEMPSPWPVVVEGPALHGQRLAVPLGLTPRKVIAGIDFAVRPHLLAVGPTQRGKTTAMRALAFHLARQNSAGSVALFAITFKAENWQAFGGIANCWHVITDPPEAAEALLWLREHMLQRAKRQIRQPAIFAFVDDLANLLGVAEVGNSLAELASMGGGVGIHLVIGTQRLGERGAGDALVTSNIPDRLVFGTASAADAAYYTGRGQTGAEKLGAYIGDALLVSDGGAQRLAVGYVADGDLLGLRRNSAIVRPWAGKGLGAAVAVAVAGPAAPAAPAPASSVPAGLLTRPPTDEDVVALRALYAKTGSKNQVYAAAQVAKNPLRAHWLTQALGGVA